MITKAIFGEGHKNEAKLGKGVFKQYGKGAEGFILVHVNLRTLFL